ncbi:zinc-ribbon domain-containing protein [Geomonas limicola]|uniref:zinc-ribbon domain-containing protein n=1 Tax=Geomonas limicola TaxID=2740186 RepID=UPI0016105183|nr:zinc-ribbon domain-containing protein [Geomonas limicola]
MMIECPSCGFSTDVNPEKIPSQTARATCPRCSAVFLVNPAEPVKTGDGIPVQREVLPPKTSGRESNVGSTGGTTSTTKEKVLATFLGLISGFTLFSILYVQAGSKLLFQFFFWPLVICKALFLSNPKGDGIPLGEILVLAGGFAASIAFQIYLIYLLILFLTGKLGRR